MSANNNREPSRPAADIRQAMLHAVAALDLQLAELDERIGLLHIERAGLRRWLARETHAHCDREYGARP